MIKKIKINDNCYFFDTSTLTLFKDKVVKSTLPLNNIKNECSTLYKLVFNVSNICNLRCKYCYASCGNYGRENNFMTKDTVDNIISELVKSVKKIKTVYFFGGEPTLNPEIIEYIVNKLNESYKISDYRVVTNATVVNEKLINLFIDNNFKVYISIDGPKEINTYLRGDYFDRLIATINKLKNSSIGEKLELICTYTKYHQENIEFENLVKFYENLGVKYSISDVITNDKSLKIIKTKQDILNQEMNYIDLSLERLYNNSLNVGISVYVRNIIEALVLKNKTDCFCKELKSGYSRVYDYNGDVYPCIRLIGKYKSDDLIVEKCNTKTNKQCSTCWAKNICRDCVADVILKNINAPYISRSCYKKKLYLYTLTKCVKMNHENPEKFKIIINNYFKNYLF